jgi:hypothetical protein
MYNERNMQTLTKTRTASGYFMIFVMVSTTLYLVGKNNVKYGWIFMMLAAATPVMLATRYLYARRQVSSHPQRVTEFAARGGYELEAARAHNVISQPNLLNSMPKARDQSIADCFSGPDWDYGDFTYTQYRYVKNGEYPDLYVYYGVIATQLPRALPNVFFDSKRARGKQFRFQLSASQKHSLEGDFDRYFVTYFPPDYTIDALSFITPEVMWALRGAADYDIEIVEDRLLLYGPWGNPDKQIPDMAAKIMDIKKQLMNNIITYRDERLPTEQGRLQVAENGKVLRGSKIARMLLIITVSVWLTAAVVGVIIALAT